MPTPIRLLSVAEYDALEMARRNGVKGTIKQSDYFEAGVGFFATWYHDPLDWSDNPHKMKMDRERGLAGQTFLSVHYWRDWSDKRPPIILFTPNMKVWCPDQKSTNGDGWHVTDNKGLLTIRPSIVVAGYHGWVTDNVFSDDIEGRGERGLVGA